MSLSPTCAGPRRHQDLRSETVTQPADAHREPSEKPAARGLTGSTVIVTGGATLIGQAVVRAFHARDASVAVADIDTERGQALATELGERVFFSATDITNDGRIAAFVASTAKRFG